MSASGDAEEIKNEGNLAFQKGEYQKAIRLYTSAIEAHEEPPAAYFGNRSAAYLAAGNFERALEDSEAALRVDHGFLKAYSRIGKCHVAAGDLVKAQLSLQEGFARATGPTQKLFADELAEVKSLAEMQRKGEQMLEQKSYGDALSLFSELQKRMPRCRSLEMDVALAMIGLRQYDAAIKIATGVLTMDSSNVRAIYVRGLGLYRTGNFDSATALFRKALQLNPDFEQARVIHKLARTLAALKEEGNAQFGAKNYAKAVEIYTEALVVDPENENFNKTLLGNRSAAYVNLEQYESALKDCDEALRIDPNYEKILLRRGDVFLKLGHYDRARGDYEAYKQRHPRDRTVESQINHKIRELQLEQKKAERKDYYKIMGLSKSANPAEIKKAYRGLAAKYHPDRYEGDKDEGDRLFKELGEAYSVLSDPQKKQRYDTGADLQEGMGMGGFQGMDGVDLSDILGGFPFHFGGGGMGGMGGMGRGPQNARSRRGGGGFHSHSHF